jgi:DNA-directed RNA polymerase specialized sigma24 family protein
MASNSKDIEQEAILAAFYTLSILANRAEENNKFGAYFRVQFRTRCIKMATGGMVGCIDDIDQIPSTNSEQKTDDLDLEMMQQALQRMSNRQRQLSEWILAQPTPVSTTIVAKKFGIRSRTVRAILCNAVNRIQRRHYGNPAVCKDISVAA